MRAVSGLLGWEATKWLRACCVSGAGCQGVTIGVRSRVWTLPACYAGLHCRPSSQRIESRSTGETERCELWAAGPGEWDGELWRVRVSQRRRSETRGDITGHWSSASQINCQSVETTVSESAVLYTSCCNSNWYRKILVSLYLTRDIGGQWSLGGHQGHCLCNVRLWWWWRKVMWHHERYFVCSVAVFIIVLRAQADWIVLIEFLVQLFPEIDSDI